MTTPQQQADILLAAHQAARRKAPSEQLSAVLELCGVVQGLILTDCVPDYMIDYLKSRVERVRSVYGLASVDLISAKDLRREA